MRLDGAAASIQLSIEGYQYPKAVPRRSANRLPWRRAAGFDHDANWLIVAGHVSAGDDSWRFRDPCLLTVETEELAAWLEGIADGRSVADALDFLEPNLRFGRAPTGHGRYAIRVWFELEARPPWRPSGDENEWGTVWLDVVAPDEVLRKAAQDLRDDLRWFPERR